jgi:hypothetical protein
MGQSTNAVLIYGYDLGGGEKEWLVDEASGDYGDLRVDWYDEEGQDDFVEAAMKRLRVSAGFTETDWRADGFFRRQREADDRVAVKFETYCASDYPIYTLAAHVITVHRGDLEVLDLAQLQRLPGENGWDAKLTAALATLGLTPKQEKPGWLLCSWWGDDDD